MSDFLSTLLRKERQPGLSLKPRLGPRFEGAAPAWPVESGQDGPWPEAGADPAQRAAIPGQEPVEAGIAKPPGRRHRGQGVSTRMQPPALGATGPLADASPLPAGGRASERGSGSPTPPADRLEKPAGQAPASPGEAFDNPSPRLMPVAPALSARVGEGRAPGRGLPRNDPGQPSPADLDRAASTPPPPSPMALPDPDPAGRRAPGFEIPQPAPSRSPPVSAAPSIRVSIGRIELRAQLPEPVRPKTATPKPSPYRPPLTLEDYLKQRGGGS